MSNENAMKLQALAVVAAGAVVTKDVTELTAVGGVPARMLKKINCKEAHS